MNSEMSFDGLRLALAFGTSARKRGSAKMAQPHLRLQMVDRRSGGALLRMRTIDKESLTAGFERLLVELFV